MKKEPFLTFLGLLIILSLCLLGLKVYEDYTAKDIKVILPVQEYSLNSDGYEKINEVVTNEYIYILYRSGNSYLLRELNTQNSNDKEYKNTIDASCKLQNESSIPYIVCKDKSSIKTYDIYFNFINETNTNSEYDYALNYNIYQSNNTEYPVVLTSSCKETCYIVRKNELLNKISLYEDSDLLEINVKKYKQYESGIITYTNNKIKVYNIKNNDYKEFSSPKDDIESRLIMVSNNYNLYILNNKEISVYNLYNKSNIKNIDLFKIKEKINNMYIILTNLYLLTDNYIYIYDLSSIEKIDNDTKSSYENILINNKIKYLENNYNVTISFDVDSGLHGDYEISKITNYNDIVNALSYVEDYFLMFNKEFFTRFYEMNMNGLKIFLANDIKGSKDGYNLTDVVGLSYQKNNTYIIVVKANNSLLKTLVHETMHTIDNYLILNGYTYDTWNSLNNYGFTYSHKYYINETFTDTLSNYENNEDVYFVDAYGRSSEKEDRARIFEQICLGKDLSEYPNLYNKEKYLKNEIVTYFPEISYIKNFQNN
ncbi:putative uncharacterized protein [Clostridium sp. CAG:609]|nr:putative uncharacterized protein [Clostridium sp. CAG:609]